MKEKQDYKLFESETKEKFEFIIESNKELTEVHSKD